MSEILQFNRLIYDYLPLSNENTLVLLTGSRQTGKTTSVKYFYNDLYYYDLDSIEYREQLSNISSFGWGVSVGNAILDEVQKEPMLLDKIKYAFDSKDIRFSVLLGSSQILLLKKVRESLAGRVYVFELWPLCLSEIITKIPHKIKPTLFKEILLHQSVDTVCRKKIELPNLKEIEYIKRNEEYLLQWGGMPGLLSIENSEKKWAWLKSFELTYLERDLRDLARVNDLKPFKKFQKLAALRCSSLLSFSEIARDAGVSVETARRYTEYLRISYQVFFIQPYYVNLTSSTIKTPKMFWTDIGILRQLSGKRETTDGAIYENYVVSEMVKYIKTTNINARVYFYRTRSGFEIDIIIETEKGFMGIEIKSRDRIANKDISGLKKLKAAAGKRWCGGIVIYRGNRIYKIADTIWAIPSYRLFS